MAHLVWLLPLAAYWSVWIDYAQRMIADPDSVAHLAAGLAGVVVLWRAAPSSERTTERAAFVVAVLCVLSFALGYAQLSAMPRCALALLGSGAFVCWQRGSARPFLGSALLLLALPALGQLEHLIGFSVRLSVADASAALLRSSGLTVTSEGTRLAWAGGFVDVEAPCSGLRMLWTGSFVSLLAITHFQLRAREVALLALGAPPLIWLANVLRCASLFYVEGGFFPAPQGMHAGVGLVVFGGVCAALWESARWLARRRLACAAS